MGQNSTLDDSASLKPLLDEIKLKHGDALLAILVYGSWLRGKRDTMLDFYVLVENYQTLDSKLQGWACRLLPPNVYHIHHQASNADSNETDMRAKYALLTLDRFCHCMQHDFHSYFWARFAQPCKILYCRDESIQTALNSAFLTAAATFERRVAPLMPDHFTSREFWIGGLTQTYRCELRTESSNRADSLYDFNPGYFDELTASMATASARYSLSTQDSTYTNKTSVTARKLSSFSWWLRRVQGKTLSMLRLLKAVFTFNDSLQYLLWKVERHTGIYITPSQRQLNHPLIFAWPLLWKLYRQGAFR